MIFLGVQELAFVRFSDLLSSIPNTFTLGGHKFLIFNPFLMILSVSDVSRGGAQVMFGHQKQWSPPLGSGLP
jgi:hypothetical protein